MSNNGGDEDWVAVVPPALEDSSLGWLEEGTAFGCSSVQKFKDGRLGTVYIGSHS